MNDLVYKPKWGQYFQLTEKGINYAMRIARAMHKVCRKRRRRVWSCYNVHYVYIPYKGNKTAFIARVDFDYAPNRKMHYLTNCYRLVELVPFKGY